MEAQIALNTMAADKGSHGADSQLKRPMPDVGNQQTLPTTSYTPHPSDNSTSPIVMGSTLSSHSSPSVSVTLLPQCPPNRGQLDEDRVESANPLNQHSILSTTTQQIESSPPDHSSRYTQAFSLMTSLFGTNLNPAKLIIVIRTGDRLIRDDTVPFLKEQVPLWKGMWYKADPLIPSSDDSITDHFVQVSRCIAILKERSIKDRIRVLLHKILQYQFYLCFLDEVRQGAMDPGVKRRRGVRDAAYALDHLLEKLYIDDWEKNWTCREAETKKPIPQAKTYWRAAYDTRKLYGVRYLPPWQP